MNLWPFGQREKRESVEDPAVPLNNIVEIISANAKAFEKIVTPQTIMECAPAAGCVMGIANTIASLPLQVYEKDGDNRKVADSNPLNYLLHDAPADDLTSYRWRRWMFKQVLTTRRAFSYINRNATGRPVSLVPLNQSFMEVRRVDGRLRYYWRPVGLPQRIFEPRDVLHFTFDDDDETIDASSAVPGKTAIALYMALEDYAGRFFSNDCRPSIILEHPGNLTDQAIKNLKQSIQEQIGGANKFKPLVAEEGMKVATVGNPPEQSQLVELLERQIREVARVWNYPLSFLQDPSKTSYASAEQDDIRFTKHCIGPHIKMAEQEMNLKLIGQRNTKNSIEFNVDGLLRGDFKTRMDGYAVAIQNGINTPNEVRALENWPRIDGGDDLMIQQNMTPVDQLAELIAGKLKPADPAPPAEGDSDAET